mgnify:CR=1 FL=1
MPVALFGFVGHADGTVQDVVSSSRLTVLPSTDEKATGWGSVNNAYVVFTSGALRGRLPDAAMRQRMVRHVQAL